MKSIDVATALTAVLLMLTLSPVKGNAEPSDTNVTRILAMARAATGGAAWDSVKSLHLTGKRQNGDVSAKEEVWVDAVHGLLAISRADANGAERLGYDGKAAWTDSQDGSPTLADTQQRQELVAEAYWRSYGWIRPISNGMSVVWLKSESHGGRDLDVVRVTPVGGTALEISFDRVSHLPVRIETTTVNGTITVRLADWRKFHDITVPWRIDVDLAKGGEHFQETIDDLAKMPATDVAHFDMPTAPPANYVFPSNATSVETPIKIVNDHVFLMAKIGKTRFRWRLDSAAGNAIDQKYVQTLGLDVRPGPDAIARLPDLSVGGVVLRHQLVEVRDLTPLANDEGIEVDGVLGLNFLAHITIELDYDGRRLVLVKPDGFVPPPSAASLPLIMVAKGAAIETRLDGVSALLTLDTASSAGLVVNPGFIEAHGFSTRWHIAAGLFDLDGETSPAQISRAGSVELGVLGLAQPVVTIPQTAIGQTDGRIGGAVLRHFDVIFDYPHSRLLLQETGSSNQPDMIDHAGIWLTNGPNSLIVAGVVKEGAAAKAGLHVGDKIQSVDGEKTTAASLPSIRAMLKGIPGSGFTFNIDREGIAKSLRIILSDPIASPAGSP